MAHPVHVLEQNADVQDLVNMAAVCVIDAQWRVRTTSGSYVPVGTTGELSVMNGAAISAPIPPATSRKERARPAPTSAR